METDEGEEVISAGLEEGVTRARVEWSVWRRETTEHGVGHL